MTWTNYFVWAVVPALIGAMMLVTYLQKTKIEALDDRLTAIEQSLGCEDACVLDEGERT